MHNPIRKIVMRNTMKILLKTVMIAVLGIFFSFIARTEVMAYTVTAYSDVTGSVTPDKFTANEGETVTLTVATGYTYNLVSLYLDDSTPLSGVGNTRTFTMPAHDVRVVAEFRRNRFNITFNANGGTCAETSRLTSGFGQLNLLPEVNWQNHDFVGWFTAQTGGEQVTGETVFNDDITIYAHWKYTITLNPNGGAIGGSTANTTRITGADGKLTALPEPTWQNHYFVGWFDDASSTTAVNLNRVYSADTGLTAHWSDTPILYDIRINRFGGGTSTASASESSAASSTRITLTATPAQGYSFVNWTSTNVDISNASSPTEAWFTMPTHVVTISANFSQNSSTDHTVTVTTDGHGTAQASPTNASNEAIITLSATPSSNYEFDRWTTDDDIQIVNTSSSHTTFRMIDRNVAVRAYFKAKSAAKKDENKSSDHESSSAPSNNINTKVPDGCEELRQLLVKEAASGKSQTIKWNKGTSLPADVILFLHNNPNLTLEFSYTYGGNSYVITIPGRSAIVNPSVDWYGPVYLYLLYGGDKAPSVTATTTTGSYKVKQGDTLSAIAGRLKTTVKHLKEVNNIKNADRIKPGMTLKY